MMQLVELKTADNIPSRAKLQLQMAVSVTVWCFTTQADYGFWQF